MTNKVVVIFAEGQTEIEFYKAVIIKAREKMIVPYKCKIEYADLKGIGNYTKDAIRKFDSIKKRHPTAEFHVFLCIDSDVFEYSKKPPINRTEIINALKNKGAQKATCITAKQSIEDWFLCDLTGIIKYLRLPSSTKRPKGNGQEALKKLFKNANKLYIKGEKTEGFIDKLNILKIIECNCATLKPLCAALDLKCNLICKK